MAWTSHHRRGEVLRAVVAAADERGDGRLPVDVDGVPETFRGDLDLLGALALKWHTRLSGRVETELAGQPLDLESAVVRAWQEAARSMPGVRAVLDRAREEHPDPAVRAVLDKAAAKEHVLLAVMAGRSSSTDAAAARVGAAIAERARAGLGRRPGRPEGQRRPERRPLGEGAHAAPRLLDRLRAALAA